MNQNAFASFFSPEAGAYSQLPDPLVANGYMDARAGLMAKDESLHTSTLSHDSHDSDSSPSTPSKSKRSDQHRTPKSKAEVSERMRRWRSENAEKNRLNDLRCRVYRQARIRFGKDPTPEREAWIQSEIFRRLERRRLREAMKGNGSVPAPTAMTSPTSMAMSIGGHPAGGPITRSRSTVHPFPIHMSSQTGVPDHAMNFPATPYAMMAGAGMYDSSQQQYGHGAANAPAFTGSSAYSFKFISPLYPGRILPHQASGPLGSAHPGSHATNSVDAATAAAVAAVADFSNSFQLPQSSGQAMYSYYQDSAPTWETSVSSAEISTNNGQSNSSPATPAETIAPAPSQYTLHAVDSSMYSIVSSDAQTPAATAGANAPANVSAISSLSMVNPISNSSLSRTLADSEPAAADRGIASNGNVDVASNGNESYSAASDLTAVAAAAAAVSAQQPSPANYLYGYAGQATSPSLNDVASNLFSLRQISQNTNASVDGSCDSAVDVKSQQVSVAGTCEDQISGNIMESAELPRTADSAAVGFLQEHRVQRNADDGDEIANMDQQVDRESKERQSMDNSSHQNQSLVQVPFNLNVVSDNIQF
ncbi:hypothetical protein LPJ64_005543 [Coemansia asiatica]|uniref:DUF3020 domain-containing protein n=1 Tax=Coemansia asiatica TaxID=1052880 RepID=A0A9W8CHZ7_9FUNG|nr:hypothetical protein LPJ64_005543 [Coemansia asiatica]